jgi:hypothetical protein
MYSCAVFGSMSAKGLGVRRDLEKAASLFTKSCDGNESFGCLLLAKMHQDGFGVNQDLQKAITLLDKACSLENDEACKQKEELISKLKVKK